MKFAYFLKIIWKVVVITLFQPTFPIFGFSNDVIFTATFPALTHLQFCHAVKVIHFVSNLMNQSVI